MLIPLVIDLRWRIWPDQTPGRWSGDVVVQPRSSGHGRALGRGRSDSANTAPGWGGRGASGLWEIAHPPHQLPTAARLSRFLLPTPPLAPSPIPLLVGGCRQPCSPSGPAPSVPSIWSPRTRLQTVGSIFYNSAAALPPLTTKKGPPAISPLLPFRIRINAARAPRVCERECGQTSFLSPLISAASAAYPLSCPLRHPSQSSFRARSRQSRCAATFRAASSHPRIPVPGIVSSPRPWSPAGDHIV